MFGRYVHSNPLNIKKLQRFLNLNYFHIFEHTKSSINFRTFENSKNNVDWGKTIKQNFQYIVSRMNLSKLGYDFCKHCKFFFGFDLNYNCIIENMEVSFWNYVCRSFYFVFNKICFVFGRGTLFFLTYRIKGKFL